MRSFSSREERSTGLRFSRSISPRGYLRDISARSRRPPPIRGFPSSGTLHSNPANSSGLRTPRIDRCPTTIGYICALRALSIARRSSNEALLFSLDHGSSCTSEIERGSPFTDVGNFSLYRIFHSFSLYVLRNCSEFCELFQDLAWASIFPKTNSQNISSVMIQNKYNPD